MHAFLEWTEKYRNENGLSVVSQSALEVFGWLRVNCTKLSIIENSNQVHHVLSAETQPQLL